MKNCALYRFMILGAIALTLIGCRKELDYDYDEADYVEGYRLEFEVEWELEWERSYGSSWYDNWDEAGTDHIYDYYKPLPPEGIAVILYNKDAEGNYVHSREVHISAEGGKVTIDKSTRAILLHNDDSEYITISDLSSPHTAYATTGTNGRSFNDFHSGERSINQPDMLYGAFVELEEMEAQLGYKNTKVTLRPLVYSYLVRCPIEKNAQAIALARGAMGGMAEGVNVKDGSTNDKAATIIFECQPTSYGIGIQVFTFGVPNFSDDYYTRGEEVTGQFDVKLYMFFKNGKTMNFDFDISNQMKNQPSGGVIHLNGIEIPDEMAEGTSGFNPDVESWGEETDIDLEPDDN